MAVERIAEGTVIGNAYRIVRQLSAGGMGTVYVAEQLSTGKLRAVKLMHDRLQADPKLRERFVREARVASAIESAHVVEVIGAGVEEDSGTPWLAMELLDGDDLAQHLRARGALTPAEALALLEQICHAVGEAHEQGIVHRDLKPENIFIAKTRTAGQATTVKVLDFGIAKLVAEAKTLGTSAVGSPAWMAPEQAEAGEQITPAADVWALGLLTFWMLTGASYWKTASQPNISMHAFLKEILFEALPTASRRASDLGVASRLPAGFDDWLERAVHREPRARFKNAAEQLDAFRALVEGRPAPATATVPVEALHQSTQEFLSASGIGDMPTEALEASEPEPSAPEASPAPEPKEPPVATVKSPESPTLTPVHEAARTAEPSRSRYWLFGAAVIVLAGGVFMMFRPTPVAPPAPVAAGTDAPDAPEPLTEQPMEASPPTEETVSTSEPVAPPATTAKPLRHAQTPAPTPSDSASAEPEERLPFNRISAESLVRSRVKSAEFHCKGRFDDGVKGITLGLVFSPEGRIARIVGDPMLTVKPSVTCARSLLRNITVAPFAGDADETITVTLALE